MSTLISRLGLEDGHGSKVPGASTASPHAEVRALTPEEAYEYKSLGARCNYLSADRSDIQFSTKEVCKAMSNPMTSDWEKLKKIGRYLNTYPCMSYTYKWQKGNTQHYLLH